MAKLSDRSKKTLAKVYSACLGASSEEEDPFRGLYPGGTAKMLADLSAALSELGIDAEAEEEDERAAVKASILGAVSGLRRAVEAKGVATEDLGEKGYGADGFAFDLHRVGGGQIRVECPLGFQDWSGAKGVGMVAKTAAPASKKLADELYKFLEGVAGAAGMTFVSMKPDPGPGEGRAGWFVRFG